MVWFLRYHLLSKSLLYIWGTVETCEARTGQRHMENLRLCLRELHHAKAKPGGPSAKGREMKISSIRRPGTPFPPTMRRMPA